MALKWTSDGQSNVVFQMPICAVHQMVFCQISGHLSEFKISQLLQAAILHAITVIKVTPFSLSRTTPSLGKQNQKL